MKKMLHTQGAMSPPISVQAPPTPKEDTPTKSIGATPLAPATVTAPLQSTALIMVATIGQVRTTAQVATRIASAVNGLLTFASTHVHTGTPFPTAEITSTTSTSHLAYPKNTTTPPSHLPASQIVAMPTKGKKMWTAAQR